jgi:hypothetical protein
MPKHLTLGKSLYVPVIKLCPRMNRPVTWEDKRLVSKVLFQKNSLAMDMLL